MLKLSRNEMLDRWLLLTREEPLRADCRVTRSFGIDLEALASMEMRMWYVDLLCHGPLEWVPLSEMAREAEVEVSPEGSLTITLPDDCMRPVSVELHGWERPARIVLPGSREAVMQTNPFACGGVSRPVAVLRNGGRVLEIHSSPARPVDARIRSLICVADPGDDSYVFHEDALSTIKPLIR